MIISRRFEKHAGWGTPRTLLDDTTAWSNVAGSMRSWMMNLCVESGNVLRTEGAPSRIKGGMRDVGLHLGSLGFGVHDEPSDNDMDVEVEDSSADSETTGSQTQLNPFPSFEDAGAISIAEDGLVSVTVGLPRRFGSSICSDEDPEPQVTHVVPPPSPFENNTTINKNSNSNSSNNNNNNTLREILRKVTVNETTLLAAIETLGGGVKGLKLLLEYVKHLDPNINPADFTRGLEQFCLLNSQTEATNDGSQAPGTSDGSQSQARMDPHPYTMGAYIENFCYPNFCYPYPPPFAGYGAFNMGVQPMYMPMMGVPYFPAPTSHEFVPHRTDAISRASRKSRIARRRGQGGTDFHHARPATTTTTKSATGVVAQSGNHSNQSSTSHQNHTVSSSGKVAQGLSSRNLILVLQKQLSPSGVSSLGRIVLPKNEAETHLPQLVASEGVLLTMTDYDTAQRWTFRYRFWSNNKSRMYLLENTRDFVKAHNLQERDMLYLYRDAEGSYVVRGEKDSSNQTGDAATGDAAEYIPTEEDLLQKRQKL